MSNRDFLLCRSTGVVGETKVVFRGCDSGVTHAADCEMRDKTCRLGA